MRFGVHVYVDITLPQTDWRAAYKLFLGFINPRPIGFISTRSAGGQHNLAPFSFYNMVCANPPVVMFCAALSRNREFKHTFRNAEETGEFVVATVNDAIAPRMVRTAADLPYGQSEFDFANLTPILATKVRPPLVSEAPVNIECRVRQIVSMGDNPGASRVVFGDVLAVHIKDEFLNAAGDAIDPHKLHTVGRLGEAYYCTVTEPYAMQIPRV